MSFRVAMILDRATDFSHITKGLGEMGVESWLEECRTDEDIIKAGQPADFIITVTGLFKYPGKVLKGLEKCKFIETLGVGYDGIDLATASDLGIGIINNADYHLEELSDHTMALILDCARRVTQLDRIVKGAGAAPGGRVGLRKVWYEMIRLKGKTLGLVGFGRIARAVAIKARGFDMRTVAYDPYVTPETAGEFMVEMTSLEQLLAGSDFISIHANLTPETRHLIGKEQFDLVKPGAYIINTARGAIIDETALAAAIAGGKIAGAALDVTEKEPPTADSPLLKLDTVILTGHSGHSSPESWQHRLNRPLEEIARVMRREWPIGLVNPEVKEKYISKWGEMRSPTA